MTLAPGARCLARLEGPWTPGSIVRRNEDGTFTFKYDTPESFIMPLWHGVTEPELRFHDGDTWPQVFEAIASAAGTFGLTEFGALLARLGIETSPERLRQFWIASCEALFATPKDVASDLTLDAEKAYGLILRAGFSAVGIQRQLAGEMEEPPPFYKLYWNQMRMGGRDPKEVLRTVTLRDTFTALGLRSTLANAKAKSALKAFEAREGVHVPRKLAKLFTRAGARRAISGSHPNNPEPYSIAHWKLERDVRNARVDGDFAIEVMEPHQGDHLWVAAWNEGEEDARLYVRWPEEDDDGQPDQSGATAWRLVSPTVAFFFWDLAQTGLAWRLETGNEGEKPVQQTDIGLAPAK